MIPLYVRLTLVRWMFRSLRALGKKTVNYGLASGGQMVLDTTDTCAQIRCEQAFEPAVRREITRIASRRINVVDIGANVGYYSITAARLIGSEKRVFSFEPQERVVGKLRRNIELNALSNVVVFPFALADAPGNVTFYVPTEGQEGLGSMRANGRFAVAKTVEVEARRLDDVLATLGNPEIGLVKMDAEGAEILILRGATRLLASANKPSLIFEANEANCKPFGYCVFDLLQYIYSFGYRLRQLDTENWIAESQT